MVKQPAKRIARRRLVPTITTDIIRYAGHPSIHITFRGAFTREQVEEIVEDQRKKYVEQGIRGKFGACALFAVEDEDGNRKPSQWRELLDEYQDIRHELLFKPMDGQDYFGRLAMIANAPIQAFQIIILQTGAAAGGNGYHNDCLYEALMKGIPKAFTERFPKPELFKKFLNLERDDPVPIDRIPAIEELFSNHKINVTGHHQYISAKDAKQTVTLALNFEHYSFYNAATKLEKGIAHEEKTPVVFQYVPGEFDKVRLFDGKKYRLVSYDKFCDMRSKPITCPYVFVKLMKSTDTTMRESYENFMKMANTLKEYTDGKYNLFKTGNIKRAALHRFIELNPTLLPEPLDPIEAEWISKASHGSLMCAKNDYTGEIHEYDINSAYPRVLSAQKFSMPIKKGVFKCITQEEFDQCKYFDYGIYRVEIQSIEAMLFRRNRSNYYTHYDLARAKELGMKMILIEDGQPNALLYSGASARINGDKAFGEFVKELYELKKNHPKIRQYFKMPLNIIWGAMAERYRHKKCILPGTHPEITFSNIVSLLPRKSGDKTYYSLKAYDHIAYNLPFARVAPFLLARCRMMMSRIMEPHKQHIVRVHTDGFYSTVPLEFERTNKRTIDSVKIGDELGDLKYEGAYQVTITNVNKIAKTRID